MSSFGSTLFAEVRFFCCAFKPGLVQAVVMSLCVDQSGDQMGLEAYQLVDEAAVREPDGALADSFVA